MTIARLSNWSPSLFNRFFENDLFDWSNRNFSVTNTTLPAVNIKETEDDFFIEVAAPGLKKSDFKIELKNELLTISSDKKDEKGKDQEQRFTRNEFSYQSFSRSFTMPLTGDGDKISAKYEDGILTVTIPKKEEAKPKPQKEIAIS